MGKAGASLKLVLETYGISQNKLAVALGVERGSVYRWVHEIRDPTAETVRDIVEALQGIEPAAAEEFVRLYLGDVLQDREQSKE
jgi:transcriptional regulator with XRE-family HTH domain